MIKLKIQLQNTLNLWKYFVLETLAEAQFLYEVVKINFYLSNPLFTSKLFIHRQPLSSTFKSP